MTRLAIALLAVLGLVALATPASADTLLSGDTNIIDGIHLGGAFETAGNKTFFANVLGGGTTVLVEDAWGGFDTKVNGFYNSLAGVSSSTLGGDITGGALAGVDLFITILPSVAYTAGEVAALDAFEASGGTVFFVGDWDTVADRNAHINAALSGMGSNLSIVNDLLDSGSHYATGAQIAAHPLNAGVTRFYYAAASEASIAAGGVALYYSTDDTPFVSYEAAVPEPSSLALLGLGAVGMVLIRRRRK